MLELIIITALVIAGIKRATDPGMLFHFIDKWLDREYKGILKHIMKPLYTCVYCMSSIYSVIIYSIFENYCLSSLYELPLMILAVCGLSGIVYNLNYLE